MIWILLVIVFLFLVLVILFCRRTCIEEWFQEEKNHKICSWIIKNKDKLPIDPSVINAGEWVKIVEGSVAQKDGIYLFLCKGDNHLIYEVHELMRGTSLMWNFQDERLHKDGWHIVKPIYYYYIPFQQTIIS